MGLALTDVKWGVKWGAIFGVAMTLYAVGVYFFAGPEPFDRVGLRPAIVIMLYFAGSVTAGLLVGLLKRHTTSREGAMLVGILAALPASFGMGLAFFGAPRAWSPGDWFQCVFLAMLFGAGLGYMWHGRRLG